MKKNKLIDRKNAFEWIKAGKPSALGAASGVVAGLVVITPAAGFVTPFWALIMGLLAGVVCYTAVVLKHKFGYDDTLDAFGVHGVGVFATVGASGVILGNMHQLWVQFVGVAASATYAVVVTIVILAVLKATMGLRVSEEEEVIGLDQTAHSESGYNI